MRNLILKAFSLVSLLLLVSCDLPNSTGGAVKLDNVEKKASYALGQSIGQGLHQQGFELDVAAMSAAFEDVYGGKESKMTEQEMQSALMEMRKLVNEKQSKMSEENKVKGEAFLKENQSKKGVKVTSSGLQYEVLAEGKGNMPKVSDRVRVHYKGTLIDGSEFDSSYRTNTPAEFQVGGVIQGWQEALQLMKLGSKYKLVIPSELAYGEMPRPGIPGNSVLVFEVELLDIL